MYDFNNYVQDELPILVWAGSSSPGGTLKPPCRNDLFNDLEGSQRSASEWITGYWFRDRYAEWGYAVGQ